MYDTVYQITCWRGSACHRRQRQESCGQARVHLNEVSHGGEALLLRLKDGNAGRPHAAARHADGRVADPALRMS